MGASHTGLGVYEYGFSMRGNILGVSMHREPFSYTPWGFPEHGGFPASYTGTGKPGEMGRHFSVREKSENFDKTRKVRAILPKIVEKMRNLIN